MEVLDSYKFQLGEMMNKYRKLSKVMELLEMKGDKELEYDIERALGGICEKHKVDLEELSKNTAEGRYPNLTKIYRNLDAGFDLYPESVKYERVKALFEDLEENEIGMTIEEFNNGKYEDLDDDKLNDEYYEFQWLTINGCLCDLVVTPEIMDKRSSGYLRCKEMISDEIIAMQDEIINAFREDLKLNQE